MRPPAIMAHPSTSPLPQHTPEPQDLKCNWQEDVKESGDVVSILHPHLQTGRYDGDVLPSALKGRSGYHFGGVKGGQTLTWFQGTLMVYPWPWPKPVVDQLEALRWGQNRPCS